MRFEFGDSIPAWEIRLIGSSSLGGTMTVYVSNDTVPAEAPSWMHSVIEAVREWRKVDPWYPATNGSAR